MDTELEAFFGSEFQGTEARGRVRLQRRAKISPPPRLDRFASQAKIFSQGGRR